MTALAILRLARISNLPTVWSNVLAASVLAGGMPFADLLVVLVAMSALYTSGMILNDAFDREVDARQRPERPLPSGQISHSTAWLLGFTLLAFGVALLAMFGLQAALAAVALAAAIVVYDAWHKANPASPLIMGACRALVYVGTVLAAGAALSPTVLAAASALFLFVAGLTQLSKRGFRYVGLLIAAIALFDAAVAAASCDLIVASVCVGLFILTLALQRIVSGT
ncbi:UbiA family prenyltransferase [Hyphomicrobium sp.]|uniref:UbiA family prenyltransferase n=1 Tax=Hyphomicrobium sp. TaxID=82 RepID=UPI0025BE80A6|nr:UbiA family prenyltransferase [Hyphomicrobium sp.]